jgi:hypothetical protein
MGTEADLEPDGGDWAVLLDDPPSSLRLGADDLLTVTSSMKPLDLGLP